LALAQAKWHKMSREDMLLEWPKLMPLPGYEAFTPRNWLERCWWEGGPPDVVLIATDGPNGVTVIHRDFEFQEPGVPADVVDTVGAGDAFTAAMVCLFLEGKSLRDAARFAVHYAARVCEHQGATPRIDRSEIERAAGLA
jgi:sugar/nucleoside kinase (ribokinase family)